MRVTRVSRARVDARAETPGKTTRKSASARPGKSRSAATKTTTTRRPRTNARDENDRAVERRDGASDCAREDAEAPGSLAVTSSEWRDARGVTRGG